jgi:hypothetical protein
VTTLIPAPRLTLDDNDPVDVGACSECLDLIEVEELRDCGTHTVCQTCLADIPCSACQAIRHEEAADLADDRAYDAWRDQQAEEDFR